MTIETTTMPSHTGIAAPVESAHSGVSWAAVFAGATTSTAVSLILLAAGSAMGLAALSFAPGSSGASVAAFGVGAAIWLVVIQWVASGLGGYVAGRLRTKWAGIHTDEVFFRDTAHGLLSWGVATILVAAVLVSGVAAAVRTGTEAVATVAAGAAEGIGEAAGDQPTAYLVDRLFRSPATPVAADARTEAARIIVNGAGELTFPADDRTYLAGVVGTATGLPAAEAEERVNAAIADAQAAVTEAREAADEARAAAAAAALYTFISLLIGAFVACVAAALGGRQRDEVPDIRT